MKRFDWDLRPLQDRASVQHINLGTVPPEPSIPSRSLRKRGLDPSIDLNELPAEYDKLYATSEKEQPSSSTVGRVGKKATKAKMVGVKSAAHIRVDELSSFPQLAVS